METPSDTAPTLNMYEEDLLLDQDFNGAIHSLNIRSGCSYEVAKKTVFDIAINLSLIKPEQVKPFMGYCHRSSLPIKAGMTVTIPKGTMVKRFGQPPKPAGKTFRILVNHILEGSNGYRGSHEGDRYPPDSPKVRWAGSGGYWTEVDINDIPEAL